jgi:DNA polymerase-3 subunit gamma/tau
MSELALYRKYRPGKFKEVIGQEAIVNVLESSIKADKIAHAYLFAGSRGTGKTSVARIFASALDSAPEDVYEIDGASHRGIDQIRELREAVHTLPFNSKYKVYIIDEVHMLTKEAFNALLKTLEEPPAHVIFILATTELHKVPETIVSRCQGFQFKQPGLPELIKVINSVAKKEGYSIEPAAAELLAVLGDGSFRDTLGLLQKAMSVSTDQKIILTEATAVTGAPPAKLLTELIEALLESDLPAALAVVKDAVANNHSLPVFVKMVLRQLRLILLWRLAPALRPEIEAAVGPSGKARLDQWQAHARATALPNILRELLACYDDLTRAAVQELPLELALIRLLTQDSK